jgi:hypothetical protein
MQDFTGVPAVVDLAAMRDGITRLGGDPKRVNPLVPVDLVIDHSVMVDVSGSRDALQKNVDIEFERNGERYEFLRWGQEAFANFRVVPPGTGICHQVNLEYLAQVVWTATDAGDTYAYPDSCFGTDSHTTMVNGLGVLGWGVGGIEAEAAMLGQPIAMLIPDVVGVRLTGALREGVTATDLVLTVTQMLRKKGVVGKFVEFFGSPTARPSPTWPPNTARPAASSRWTRRRSAICGCPGATSTASTWCANGARRRACGATPRRPIPCSPMWWSLISPLSSRRSPGRSGRRTGCRCRTSAPPSAGTSPRARWACRGTGRRCECRWPGRTTTSDMAMW